MNDMFGTESGLPFSSTDRFPYFGPKVQGNDKTELGYMPITNGRAFGPTCFVRGLHTQAVGLG